MAGGTRLVYGDGWEDIKDCFSGTLGLGGGRGTRSVSSHRSSRQRVYGGDHYVSPHHHGGGGGGGLGGLCEDNDCFADCGETCTKTRFGLTVLFLWVIILTIVCIVLGSNIAYSSNNALSSRLDELSEHHGRKMGSHSRLINDLSETHDETANRVANVAGQVGRLETDIDKMEGRLRGDVRGKLENVRSVLITALEKASRSIDDIKKDVVQGIV